MSWTEPDTGLEPLQPSEPLPPEAVQVLIALLEDQVSVKLPPGATVDGDGALNVTAGAVPPELLPLELLPLELLLELPLLELLLLELLLELLLLELLLELLLLELLLLELLPPELLLPPLLSWS